MAPGGDHINDRTRACLLGGALGDALGAPVEFLALDLILSEFGPRGITDLEPAYGRVGAITDDTQMTLFTAEGLVRGHNRAVEQGGCDVPSVVRHAYLRWLHTQSTRAPSLVPFTASHPGWPDGWLARVPELRHSRAPGNTCLTALHSTEIGTVDEPLNDSKGCGAVMRAAPIGLIGLAPDQAFERGCEIGALTHGHPSGWLASGYLAGLVARLVDGVPLVEALRETTEQLRAYDDDADEVLAAIDAAETMARSGPPSGERLIALGEGWIAEEALGMSIYCALVAGDFVSAVTLAVNHGGDSDSTGAITGNILGALWGMEALPAAWLAKLELREVIEQLADDLVAVRGLGEETHELGRYPGW